MIVFTDLDGTLINTTDLSFKPFKDGLQEIELNNIPIFQGAKEFINYLQELGHQPIIISDSHPKYVNKIANLIFNIPCVSLTDKPNTEKILNYIHSNTTLSHSFQNRDNFIIIGDRWLDIELGRRLNIRTILTKFYKATNIEERDGIGQYWKAIKMGATYYANNLEEVISIIQNPIESLLTIEAVFQNKDSDKVVRFNYTKNHMGFTAFRCLARQEDGECDRFARADKYYQIDNLNREYNFINKLAKGVTNYLKRVFSFKEYHWDYISYVSDKETTSPPNKMEEIFNLVDSPIQKIKLFEWNLGIQGKLRNLPNYEDRKKFINQNLNTVNNVDLQGKNIIVIDDQLTSSATAYSICQQLRNKGAVNILFIALFYLILPVESKVCPNCGKPLKIKIRKNDGKKFFSCVPPNFGGDGCGYIENI